MAVVINGDPKTELISIISKCILEINNELLKSNGAVEQLDARLVGHWGEVIVEATKIYSGIQTIGDNVFEQGRKLNEYRECLGKIKSIIFNLRYQNETLINSIFDEMNKIDERIAIIEY